MHAPFCPVALLPLLSCQCTDGQSRVGKNSGMRQFLRKAQLPPQPELRPLSSHAFPPPSCLGCPHPLPPPLGFLEWGQGGEGAMRRSGPQ